MNWQTQSRDQPLYPDLLWSRPQNKRQAGKLLIIGGHGQQFSAVARSYEAAHKAGAGTVRVVMPASLEKTAAMVPGVQFAAANQIGSFAKNALAELLDSADWADGVLLSGDLGKNSETTATIDSFLSKNEKLAVIGNSSVQSIGLSLKELTDMDNIDLILDFTNLQKLGSQLKLEKPFVSTMTNNSLAEALGGLSQKIKANIVISSEGQAWTASKGGVVNTKTGATLEDLAAYCAVWHMQNPGKPLQALSTACFKAK